jgi:MoaA/NifB/PqqE/SkfB family radical SAM enzyme
MRKEINMEEKKYPFFNNHISCRLSDNICRIKNLKHMERTIDIEGSIHVFLREINGLQNKAEIVEKISNKIDVPKETIDRDFSYILASLKKKNIIRFSEKPRKMKKRFSEIISNSIRSSIHIDITHRCNENCIHCLVNKDRKEIRFEAMKKIIHEAADLGFTNLSFSGGEPTLHPDFWEILELARDYGFYFTLFTNGINFDKNAIERLMSFYPEKVRISLYSMEPDIHDLITKISGSFKKTILTILRMKENGIRLFINCPVMNTNYENFRAVADFCYEHNLERAFDPDIKPARDLRTSNSQLQLSYKQAKEVTGFQQDADELVVNVRYGTNVCNAGEEPSIDSLLNVYPCPGLRLVLGNLKEKPLADILTNNTIINTVSNLSLDNLQICQKCDVRNGCYRCHGHAYQDTKDFTKCSSSDKRQAKIRKELMIERGTL